MEFKNVIGNEGLKRKLISMVDEGRVAHSIMFVEEDGWGALPLAIALAQYISCPNKSDGDSCGTCPQCHKFQKVIHPDMHFIFPVNATSKSGSEKKPISDHFLNIWRELVVSTPYFTEEMLNRAIGIEDKVGNISVAEAKEILSKANFQSYEGGNKYIVVWLPERMSQEAANKLLKMVEEPFSGTYFLFITHAPERVINTIRSRCLSIQLSPIDYTQISGELPPYFTMISQLLSNCIARKLSEMLSQNEEIANLGRERQKEFCKYSTTFIRKLWLTKHQLHQISNINHEEVKTVERFAAALPDPFFEKAFLYFENAKRDIEGNANAKMVFNNLINLLFVSLK